jgi:AcrR family transcriptional regulator
VSELNDRRARKKAQTREAVRTVAQRLFAERGFEAVTIADVAREADVAVQTVFNHFATKEDLFFDGHAPWVQGPAEAVRSREPGVAALSALRAYYVNLVEVRIGSLAKPERRAFVETLEACELLRAKERELLTECERELAAALLEASEDCTQQIPADPRTAARLTAAIWTSTARVLVVDRRPRVADGVDPAVAASEFRELADWTLRQLDHALGPVGAWDRDPDPDTGRPQGIPVSAG